MPSVTLLREIQAASTDSSIALADTLRKCKVLAARLRHRGFADWVSHELVGYSNADPPEYRRLTVIAKGTFHNGVNMDRNVVIPATFLPKDLRDYASSIKLHESVSSIAEMVRHSTSGAVRAAWPGDLIALLVITAPNLQHLVSAHRIIPSSGLVGILDAVRTRILDFVIAIEQENPSAGEAEVQAPPPVPPEKVTHIYRTTIYQTNVNQGQAIVGTTGNVALRQGGVAFSAPGTQVREGVRSSLSLLRDAIVGANLQSPEREEAGQALSGLERHLASSNPDRLRVTSYLNLYLSIVSAAAPLVAELQRLLEEPQE